MVKKYLISEHFDFWIGFPNLFDNSVRVYIIINGSKISKSKIRNCILVTLINCIFVTWRNCTFVTYGHVVYVTFEIVVNCSGESVLFIYRYRDIIL